MASNGNFAVNNILVKQDAALTLPTKGNRKISTGSGTWGTPTTLAANTGKWYIEYYVNTGSSGRNVGVVPTNSHKYNEGNYNEGAAGDYAITLNSGGSLYNNGSVTQTVASNMATGDIMSVAMNLDASPKTVQFYKNGSTIGSAENINTSATGPYAFMTKGHNQSTVTINAGQDSTFVGVKTSGSANATDDNGFGDFYYTPPSGFLALCTANLPIASDIDPAQTSTDFPQKQFGVVTWTGDGTTSRAITGLGLQADFIWFKDLSQAFSNRLYDTSRGINSNGGKRLFSNTTAAETDQTSGQDISAVGTDGFTLGASSANYTNYSSSLNVAWCWRANGGTTASNTDGSITSTVQANDKAGFSIITWTASGANGTIGHGLSAKPDFHLIKKRNGTSGWAVYHNSLGATKYFRLDTSDTASTFQYTYNNTEPDATKIYLGDNGLTNHPASDTYICYAWRNVEGFSKFGIYEGNGNADGPFVYTGFRPRLIVIKGVDNTSNWEVRDTERDVSNPIQKSILWDSNTTAASGSVYYIDATSTGFKIRTTSTNYNTNGNEYVFACWGDVGTKYNNTF